MYVALFIISAVATYLMWYGGILGLNIFGLCGITFIRFSKITSIIPIVGISFNVLFLIVGVFAIQYFKKHMPNSIGLRKKKRHEKQILFLYVIHLIFLLYIQFEIKNLIIKEETLFLNRNDYKLF